MKTVFPFSGGVISLRDSGEIYDTRTGKKREFARAFKVSGRVNLKGEMTFGKDFVDTVVSMMQDPEVSEWIKGMD